MPDGKQDILGMIKNNPEMHFMRGVPNVDELISVVIHEAIGAGETETKILKMGNRWLIYFKNDWISPFNAERYFSQLLKHDDRSGGSRSGIMLKAFSTQLAYFALDRKWCLNGEMSKNVEIAPPYTCGLVFSINGFGHLASK